MNSGQISLTTPAIERPLAGSLARESSLALRPTVSAKNAVTRTGITDAQIEMWGRERGLPKLAVAQIKLMNSTPPARNVGGSRSVAGVFPSPIMKCGIQFESHKCELLYLWLRHYRFKTRMILDQPCVLKLVHTDANGKTRAFLSTPD